MHQPNVESDAFIPPRLDDSLSRSVLKPGVQHVRTRCLFLGNSCY